jgi:hypothetical protein
VWVSSAEGAARLRLTGNGDTITAMAYEPLTGDPLECGGARRGSARDWLEASWDAEYPDGVYHLLDQFRAGRTGDLLVSAREGFDFRRRYEVPEHLAGHGSLVRSHMQTPVWSSEPLPAEPIRTVDLFPAMLDWLGVAAPAGIDGEAIWRPGGRERGWSKALANEGAGGEN